MGAWIEIYKPVDAKPIKARRTPRWVRGLKYCLHMPQKIAHLSHPTMGAWIEIITSPVCIALLTLSHPTMGAWIEIVICFLKSSACFVAPHDGCVD